VIFALVDYLQYRYRKGRYHHDAIISQDWRLASKAEFDSDPTPLVGDVFVVSTMESPISWAVMYYTNSLASHVAAFGQNWDVYDCTIDGVIKTKFYGYLDEKSYLMIKQAPAIVRSQPEEVLNYMKESLGQPYGWGLLFYMFLQIVFCSAPARFRWRVPIDFFLVFLLLSFVSKLFAYMGLLYLIVVLVNRLRVHSKVN